MNTYDAREKRKELKGGGTTKERLLGKAETKKNTGPIGGDRRQKGTKH